MLAFSFQILLIRSKAPFLRCSAIRHLGQLERVGLGHDVGVEGAGGHAMSTTPVRTALPTSNVRHRLRAADEVDLQRRPCPRR